MALTSALAIYLLFWTMTLFVVLPFGMRTAEEAGAKPGAGHAESAPHEFRFGRIALRTTIVSAILFGLFYANYVFGWIGSDILDWIRPAAR
jgi:predicted secreted protein